MAHETKLELDIFKLIQPELLTVDQLSTILLERGVTSHLIPEDKDKLISLYKRIAYPLGQREYRKNYRGTLLTSRRKNGERFKLKESQKTEKQTFTIGTAENSGVSRGISQCHFVSERLRPPPDLINYEKKKIRLNCSSESSKSDLASHLEKIVITKSKICESSNDLTHKKETLDSSKIMSKSKTVKPNQEELENGTFSKGSASITGKPESKKVSLKRNHLLSQETSPAPEAIPDKVKEEPAKKRKPITWP